MGGAGDDAITVAEDIKLPAKLYGGAGKDTIKGGGGDDWLYGGAGNDELDGRRGNDQDGRAKRDVNCPGDH